MICPRIQLVPIIERGWRANRYSVYLFRREKPSSWERYFSRYGYKAEYFTAKLDKRNNFQLRQRIKSRPDITGRDDLIGKDQKGEDMKIKTPKDEPELYDQALKAYYAYCVRNAYCEADGYIADEPSRALCEISPKYVYIRNIYSLLAKYNIHKQEIVTDEQIAPQRVDTISQPYHSLRPAYLKKHNVDRICFDLSTGYLKLRCSECRAEWARVYNLDGMRRFPSRFWLCPNGCNKPT